MFKYKPINLVDIRKKLKRFQYNGIFSEYFLFNYHDLGQIAVNYAISGLHGNKEDFKKYFLHCFDRRTKHLSNYLLEKINNYDIFDSDDKIININILLEYNNLIYNNSDNWFDYNELVTISTNYYIYSMKNANAIFGKWFIITTRLDKIKKIKENINVQKI